MAYRPFSLYSYDSYLTTPSSAWELASRSGNPANTGATPVVKEINPHVRKFLHACEDGDVDKVEEYYSEGVNIYATDECGNGALHYAAKNAAVNVLQTLIKSLQMDINTKGYAGKTAVCVAIEHRLLHVVELLVEMKADCNCNFENSPLEMCAWNMRYNCCWGQSSCELISDVKRCKRIKELYEKKTRNIDKCGWLAVMAFLIRDGMAIIEVKNRRGNVPYLHVSSKINVVEFLRREYKETKRVNETSEMFKKLMTEFGGRKEQERGAGSKVKQRYAEKGEIDKLKERVKYLEDHDYVDSDGYDHLR